MNVTKINLNCQKPRHFGNSVAAESSNNKKQYKHFEKLDDSALMLKSVQKAHKEIAQGNKMKLYKAMPKIAIGILGTTLAITQPGKLSNKLATGVGFLVASKIVNKVSNKTDELIDKNWKNTQDNKSNFEKAIVKTGFAVAGSLLALGAISAAGGAIIKKAGSSNSAFINLLKSDKSKLISEINNTKAGKFVTEKMLGFEQKHAKGINIARAITPFATIAGYFNAESKLAKGISKDITQKASLNFAKGKLIQQEAKRDFDNIDAIEV